MLERHTRRKTSVKVIHQNGRSVTRFYACAETPIPTALSLETPVYMWYQPGVNNAIILELFGFNSQNCCLLRTCHMTQYSRSSEQLYINDLSSPYMYLCASNLCEYGLGSHMWAMDLPTLLEIILTWYIHSQMNYILPQQCGIQSM